MRPFHQSTIHFQLSDLDLETYYDTKILESPDENVELLISKGTFSWRKELSTNEKLQLHSINKGKPVKGKGKGKKSALTMDKRKTADSHVLEEEDNTVFKLCNIDCKIKKV